MKNPRPLHLLLALALLTLPGKATASPANKTSAENPADQAQQLQRDADNMVDASLANNGGQSPKLPPMKIAKGPYDPEFLSPCWKSYRVPDWYRDAKIGVWLHWGPSSIEGKYGWPFHWMYVQGRNDEMTAKYGHPSRFGWKDMIARWKGEKWDPDALTAFFRKVGFRYMIPIACHHDSFDLYDSTYQPWNSVNMGIRRDVIGEWRKACDKHALRMGVGDHRMWSQLLMKSLECDTNGPLKGVPYDGARLTGVSRDPLTGKMTFGKGTWKEEGKGTCWENRDPRLLYGPFTDEKGKWTPEFLNRLFLRTKEMIDKYHPDLIYFDGGVPPFPDGVGEKIYAHYYNTDFKLHGGTNQWVLNIKSCPPQTAGVVDYEAGMSDRMMPFPWSASQSLQKSWFYSGEELNAGVRGCIHSLADVVSKNGNYQLNVSLAPDGSLPEKQRKLLEEFGEWLAINGEAIYGSRPWKTFGEGPTPVSNGGGGSNLLEFTARDIRFTTVGKTLYMIVLGEPDKEIRAVTLGKSLGWSGLLDRPIASIALLGSDEKVVWEQKANGLHIQPPKVLPCRHAITYRITLKDPDHP